jgi:AP-1-like factor
MEPFVDNPPLWDLSHASSFSQLADDDFLALLQKQFPTEGAPVNSNTNYPDAINPQNISRYSLASMTPPSEDSSPSPPNLNDTGNDEGADPALKRKASDDSMEGGPSQKTQHTGKSSLSTFNLTSLNVYASDLQQAAGSPRLLDASPQALPDLYVLLSACQFSRFIKSILSPRMRLDY